MALLKYLVNTKHFQSDLLRHLQQSSVQKKERYTFGSQTKMDGWMDGLQRWMGGWVGGWVGAWMDGWMDGWMMDG